MQKILIILGPTATGKTDIALGLAKKLNGELVACDSRQVYKSLDIGTGKMPTPSRHPEPSSEVTKGEGFWEINGIKVWLYDVVSPEIQYSVFDYVNDAEKAIKGIQKRGKLPIIVGGTGLYLRGLLQGFENMKIPINEALRGEMEGLSVEELQGRLSSLSPIELENMNASDKVNPRRLIRKIEHVYMYPYIDKTRNAKNEIRNCDILKIGLTAPRLALNSRIDLRLDSRIDSGLISEGKKLLESGVSLERMRSLGLEYGVLADLLSGQINEEEFRNRLKIKIHQYAKRQMTFFKTDRDIKWFDIIVPDTARKVESEALNWYNQHNL